MNGVMRGVGVGVGCILTCCVKYQCVLVCVCGLHRTLSTRSIARIEGGVEGGESISFLYDPWAIVDLL